HGGSNVVIVFLQAALECLDRRVDLTRGKENFSRAAPDHHQPVAFFSSLEVADVGAQLLGQLHLVAALLDVLAIQLLDVIPIKDRLTVLDGFEKRLDLSQQLFFQNASVHGSFKSAFFKDVPSGEYQVIEVCQRNKILDFGRATLSTLAQADGPHLRQRTDGLG